MKLVALISLFIFAAPAPISKPLEHRFDYRVLQTATKFKKPLQATVAILSTQVLPDGERTLIVTSSGVIVEMTPAKKLRIVFAYHSSENIKPVNNIKSTFLRVYLDDGPHNVLGIVLYDDPESDLALLETVSPWNGPDLSISLAPTPPKRGDPIFVIGAPNHVEQTIRHGVLSTEIPCASREKETCWMTDAPIYFGNSGGGVYDDTGYLIGIALFLNGDTFLDNQLQQRILVHEGQGGLATWYTLGTFLAKAGVIK